MAQKTIAPIGVSTPVEDVVKWDSEGKILRFDEQDFQVLPSDVVLGLSTLNRKAYFVAKGIYDIEHDPDNGQVEEDILIRPEALRNQATRLLNPKLRNGIVKYHARPEDIAKFKLQGFRVATETDLADPADRASLDIRHGGYTDLRMLVRDKDVAERYKREKKKRNQELRSGKRSEDGQTKDNKAELSRMGVGKTFESLEMTEE